MSKPDIPTLKVFWLFIFFLMRNPNFSFSQQNLFNAPSSEITTAGKVFFQQQINISGKNCQSNSTLDFGLGKNWEVGANILGLSYNYLKQGFDLNSNYRIGPLDPQILLNIQKVISVHPKVNIGFGFQAGSNFYNERSEIGFTGMGYANSQTSLFDEKLKVNLGTYLANQNYLGFGNYLGLMGGFDFVYLKN